MIRRSLAAFLTLATISVVLLLAFRDAGNGGAATPEPAPNATGTAAEDPTTSSTLGPDEVTAGEIADRIAAAWSSVTSYRSTTRVFTAGATPQATPGTDLTGTAERYVILPDQKRIVIYDGNGTIEIIFSGGVLQQRQTPYGAETGEWVTIDPTAIEDDDPFAVAYASILAPEQPPYSALGQRQRDRIGTRGDTVTINGRECVAYLFPEVTVTGDQIRITIYLGPDDLPCRIETLAGVSVSQTDYVFNQEVAIATPAS
ncbi:MAG: hypothetical protein M3Y37_03310 [Chloroflexota bacterium]|jgi:hypothetical protein|nr:hypothetical protein [Chloroflexota bacterium]